MSFILRRYTRYCEMASDINEHIPTLYKYALQCNHITECGVRNAVSSYAFALGLYGKNDNKLIQVDIEKSEHIEYFTDECEFDGINTTFYECSDLECPREETDLLFIDTWHVYGQLKRELARWHSYAKKYIILHDTTVDGEEGESIRLGSNILEQINESGFTREEILKGLWPAVEEFLLEHPDWILKERYVNNNGLTILARKE